MLRTNRWWWLLAAVFGLRLLSMAIVPLADTSEPRYAEIARIMATTGDWITPWFEPGKPFWGKPPLSFWTEALSFRLFGISEFAARLPSWLATLATLPLIFALAKAYRGLRAARWAVLVFGTCVLSYVALGAVLTDPFLVLGTTLCMTSFILAPTSDGLKWRYGFFVGLAIGLLSKGPLALVLVAGPIIPWMLLHRNWRDYTRALPWFGGLLLTAVLVVPWYVLAEIKTPGFLDYFIVGEHIRRYLDPGWAGDLYGTAHLRPYGSIWWYWIMATFPWGFIALGIAAHRFFTRGKTAGVRTVLAEPLTSYILAWALFALVFFTVARNVLWTYVLPAIPAFSILLGAHIAGGWRSRRKIIAAVGATLAIPVVGAVLAVLVMVQPGHLNTERDLVSFAQRTAKPGESLLYLDSRPFSARYYSQGEAELVPMTGLRARLAQATTDTYLAIPKDKPNDLATLLGAPVRPLFESGRYSLIRIPAHQQVRQLADQEQKTTLIK